MKKLISAMLIVMLALPVTLTAYASNYGIVITRNPYSGTWAEGESAWFEACAQYYSTMEWIFVDIINSTKVPKMVKYIAITFLDSF